jgi:PAS domain S-box-containing protein
MGSVEVRSGEFLSKAGEMGRLIAAFDWSATTLGPIDDWPETIKTTVGLILRSPVPIVTCWGEDGVMIYNDAYSVFAARRHPQLLGSKVREGWPEVADFNDNMMKTVFGRGQTLSFEDQELTLYRHGAPEQVWMNLDYSQVVHQDGTPAGIIAIVVETTAKVRAEQRLSGERERLRQMFDDAPGFTALLEGPDYVFALANRAYFDLIGRSDVIGKPVATALPEIAEQGFIALLDRVAESREPFVGRAMPVRLERDGGILEERFVDFVFQPMIGSEGELTGIFVQGHDVTDHKRGEILRDAHTQVLQLAIEDRPFHETLQALVRTVEEHSSSGVIGSILLLDADGVHLRHGAAPSLPNAYNAAIDGIQIGSTVGSCGTAAYTKAPVFVSDIATDPLWSDFRELALSHGLRACWSTPIISAGNDVLGTFALYHREPGEPFDHDLELVRLVTGSASLVIERQRSQAALKGSEERFRRIFEQTSDLILTADLNQVITDCNPAAAAAVGLTRPQAVGRKISDFVSPEDFDRTTEMLRTKLEQGGTTRYDVRVRGSSGEWLLWEINSGLTFNEAGAPVGLHVVGRDVTDRKRFEKHQRLLVGELNHRVKNTLAIVQSLAHQTFRQGTAADAGTRFEGRLEALAAAHNLLTRENWDSASIREVITQGLTPFCQADRCLIDGPELRLAPKTAVGLALAVHELATNASKYGALSIDSGRVSVRWTVEDGKFELVWREEHGPAVSPPSKQGFGTRMIERSLAAEFGGTVELNFNRTGVNCRVTAPLAAIAEVI